MRLVRYKRVKSSYRQLKLTRLNWFTRHILISFNADFHDLLKMKILKIITDDLCKCNNEFDTPQITLRTEYDLLTKKKLLVRQDARGLLLALLMRNDPL